MLGSFGGIILTEDNMANQWFKFYGGEFLADTKISRLTPAERSCWVTLMCLASMSEDGVIKYLTVESLLDKSGIKWNPYDTGDYENCQNVLTTFSSLMMISVSNDVSEIKIINWSKRQETSLTNAERQSKFREKHKENKDSNKKVTNECYKSNARIEENRIDTLETLNTKIPSVDLKTKKKDKKKDMTWKQYKEDEIQLDEDYSPPQEEKSKKTWNDVDKKMWADKKNSLGLHGEIFMEYVIVKGLNFPTRASADACWYEFKKPAEEIASSYPYKEKVFEAIVKAQAERKPEMWNLRSIIKIMPTL